MEYLCSDGEANGKGNTLENAYQDYKNYGNEEVNECYFYELTLIEVMVTLQKVEKTSIAKKQSSST